MVRGVRGMHKAEVEWRDPVDILTAATQVERYSSKVRTVLDSGRSPMLSTVGQLVLHHISTVEKQLSVTPNKVCVGGGGGYELAWNGTWHRSLNPRPVTFQNRRSRRSSVSTHSCWLCTTPRPRTHKSVCRHSWSCGTAAA